MTAYIFRCVGGGRSAGRAPVCNQGVAGSIPVRSIVVARVSLSLRFCFWVSSPVFFRNRSLTRR